MAISQNAIADLVKVDEAAAALGCTDGRVRQLLLAGVLKGRKIAATLWLIERSSVEQYAAREQTVGRPRSADPKPMRRPARKR